MKTRVDLPPDPNDWWIVGLFHAGAAGPGPDRLHDIFAAALPDAPGGTTWNKAYPDQVAAQGARDLLIILPNIPQDLCYDCRYLNFGPIAPRWNIYRGGPFHSLTPCQVLEV